jgi:single-strand DNA-binding protein
VRWSYYNSEADRIIQPKEKKIMASLNKVMLIGNLTRDVQLKQTPKGVAVADVSIAVNEKYKTPDGQSKEIVTYVDVVLWGKQAELAAEYLAKGSSVFFEGRLQLDQWEDNGQKRSRMRVRADRMQFLGGRKVDASGNPRPASGGRNEDPVSVSADAYPEDEIPF